MEISQLINGLNSSTAAERREAAGKLARLGEDARAAAIPLVHACADEDEEVLEWASSALEELGPPAVDDAGGLAELLATDKSDIGYWAATLLGRLEANASPYVTHLASAVSGSPHASVRQRAAWALGKVGSSAGAAKDELQQATAADDPRLARIAKESLQQIGG